MLAGLEGRGHGNERGPPKRWREVVRQMEAFKFSALPSGPQSTLCGHSWLWNIWENGERILLNLWKMFHNSIEMRFFGTWKSRGGWRGSRKARRRAEWPLLLLAGGAPTRARTHTQTRTDGPVSFQSRAAFRPAKTYFSGSNWTFLCFSLPFFFLLFFDPFQNRTKGEVK